MTEHHEYQSLKTLDVSASSDNFAAHAHQKRAWDALSAHFLDRGQKAGLLVIPTGGGKTNVAAKWLLEHWVGKGGKLLWLAHRKELVRQAMETFVDRAACARPKKTLGLIAVSSQDEQWSRVGPREDAVFCTSPTAVRSANEGFIEGFKRGASNGLFVVLDEAHHAPAPQIARLLKTLKAWGCPLLGLTATPVRTEDVSQRRLAKLFDENVIFRVTRSELVENGILATPTPETVKTSINFEREFTDADRSHLANFGELGDRVLAQLAAHAGRNKQIVEHYKRSAEKYGPTIVFAANIAHAATLAEEFRAAGIDADYVSYSRDNAQEIIRRYRDKKGPRVLINVEMLTEGFDAPHTRTVFLARPTSSEALLTQMVGRALRGPKAGGNKQAFLVTFVDTWREYNPIEPEFVLGLGEDAPAEVAEAKRTEVVTIPYELVTEAYRLLNSVARGQLEGVFECLPHSWYVWEEVLEDDVHRRLVMVYDHQRAGFDAMLAAFSDGRAVPEQLDETFGLQLRREYFADVRDPPPRWVDLVALVAAHKNKLEPQRYTFEEKKTFDPDELASSCIASNLGLAAIQERIRELWEKTGACRVAYRNDQRTFHEEVMQAITRASAPPRPPAPPKLVELVPTQLASWPEGNDGYSLIELRDAVVAQGTHFPKGAPTVQELRWSKALVGSYWGMCRTAERSITINRALNSPDVPRFVMEFLMYHELLHLDMPSAGHNQDFRTREYRFMPSPAAVSEAHAKGYEASPRSDGWRVLGDQFLDQFSRNFTAKGQAAEVDY